MATAKSPKGYILYEGPSVLDGKPIVVIATMKTDNSKTGNVVQTWILRADMNPLEALAAKEDVSVCGVCPLRQSIGGACYVTVFHSPLVVWKAWKRGAYSVDWQSSSFAGRVFRLGSYGDPAAVPMWVWTAATRSAAARVGYTHQLAHPKFDPAITEMCMVSAETPKGAAKAQAQGFRTFRVKSPETPSLDGEVVCLADSKGLTCVECRMCNGTSQGPSVVIDVHGPLTTRYESKYRTINLRVA